MRIEHGEILKFGGTSVKDCPAIEQSAEVVGLHSESKKGKIVIVSAMSGVTNSLLSAMNNASKRDQRYEPAIQRILQQHIGVIDTLALPTDAEELRLETHKIIGEVKDILHSTYLVGSPISSIPSHLDYVVSAGERLMAPIFASHLRAGGTDAVAVDANEVFCTNKKYGDAIALVEPSKKKMQDNVLSHLDLGKVVVIPGFYGYPFTTFGRGGSDYSATKSAELLSYFVDVTGVYLYKADVAGALSGDPQVVGEAARLVAHLTYEEAAALAVSSAKILHPRSIGPVKARGIPLYCRNTFNPLATGTTIDSHVTPDDYRAKIVSALKGMTWLRIDGWAMDRPGIVARISKVLAEEMINIQLISQPVSEQAVDFSFSLPEESDRILGRITKELNVDLNDGNVEGIRLTNKMAVVEVVGHGIRNPDVLGAIAQGLRGNVENPVRNNPGILSSGPVDLSVLLEDEDNKNADNTVRSIHAVIEQSNS